MGTLRDLLLVTHLDDSTTCNGAIILDALTQRTLNVTMKRPNDTKKKPYFG